MPGSGANSHPPNMQVTLIYHLLAEHCLEKNPQAQASFSILHQNPHKSTELECGISKTAEQESMTSPCHHIIPTRNFPEQGDHPEFPECQTEVVVPTEPQRNAKPWAERESG